MDMTKILLDTYDLADDIRESSEVKIYLQLQKEIRNDSEAKKLITEFQKVKEMYEEAQRYGIFHPNYHEAKEKAKQYQNKLNENELIRSYLKAEDELDQLLHSVSSRIARSVSPSIKVPTNQPIKKASNLKKCKS